jgi:ABC-type Na+ efflux pump permease subunit
VFSVVAFGIGIALLDTATTREEAIMEGTRQPQSYTGALLTVGFLFIVAFLAYLNVRLGFGNGFRYAADLRIAFLLICLAFVAGVVGGLTQLKNR